MIEITGETGRTLTLVGGELVNASGVVETRTRSTFVYVYFAIETLPALVTFALVASGAVV